MSQGNRVLELQSTLRAEFSGDIRLVGDDDKIEFNTSGASGHPAISMDSNAAFSFLNTSGGANLKIANDGTLSMGSMGTNNDGFEAIANSSVGGLLSLSSSTETDQERMRFFNGNGKVGTIKTNGTATSFNTSSDYRLKENEVPISDGLKRLNKLKPYKFNFKNNKDNIVDGFFAHEVQEFIPNAVSGVKDGEEMQQIDHSKLVPLLVASIQELSAKVTELEERCNCE
jgi:hypothetical protein